MMCDIIVLFENRRFRPSHVNEKPEFSKISTLERVLKRSVFGDRFHQIHVKGGPNRGGDIRFQTKTDTYGRVGPNTLKIRK